MAGDSKKVKQLISDLNSANKELILKSLKGMYEHGTASVISPVIKLWREDANDEIVAEIAKLLESLKSTDCILPLIEEFRQDVNVKIRRQMVAIFWNSKLDFSKYLSDFVLFAVEGDFLDAFEVATLIEQFEAAPSESENMETQLILREYFGQSEGREEKKDAILAQLASQVVASEDDSEFDDFYFEE